MKNQERIIMKYSRTVDEYISKNIQWQDELNKLRKIFLSTELDETVKWGVPTYTFEGKNIAGLAAFKSYVGIWFFQGALLKDNAEKLVNAQEGTTKALRQWRFNSKKEIDKKLIRQYIAEAIENQKKGKQIKAVRNKPLIIPDELQKTLQENQQLNECFNQFTLTKQREFAEYIFEAKRDETKVQRLQKIIPLILEKKGLYDKYKNY